MPVPTRIRGWGRPPSLAVIRGPGLASANDRGRALTSGRTLQGGDGPARGTRPSPARGTIRGGRGRRTGCPDRSSARGHGRARGMPRLIRVHVPEAARRPIRAVRVSAPGRHRAGTLSRRPRLVPRVPGRPTRGPGRVVPEPMVQARAGPASLVPVPVVPRAVVRVPAAREEAVPGAGGPDTGVPAADPAASASSTVTATQAVNFPRAERPARACRREPRAMSGLAQVSRVSPGQGGSRRAARGKPVPGSADKSGPHQPALVGETAAATLPVGAGGSAGGCPGSCCGSAWPCWPWVWPRPPLACTS